MVNKTRDRSPHTTMVHRSCDRTIHKIRPNKSLEREVLIKSWLNNEKQFKRKTRKKRNQEEKKIEQYLPPYGFLLTYRNT